MYIDHHLSELWKKEKGIFYETLCDAKCELNVNAAVSTRKITAIWVVMHRISSESQSKAYIMMKNRELLVYRTDVCRREIPSAL